MKVTIITNTPEQIIGECAKVCYSAKSIEDGGRDITYDLIHGKGHLAVLRFAFAVVRVEGISIACQNQLVRSKHLDFLVESKRYVSAEKGGFEFIMPPVDEPAQVVMNKVYEMSMYAYNELLEYGVKKEDARAILPMNTSTKMNVAGNLQAWSDFFKLRITTHAQLEIRLVAIEIAKQLNQLYPQVFPLDKEYNGKTLGDWINEKENSI